MKRPQLAKLTRPRLHKAVARERLFAKLDDAREHKSAICVVGPPGAGKTTLVASWLDARGIKGIWYQVDSGDADPATFFYYLGEAARPFMRKSQQPLPLLTPEYLQDVEGFSRRFFRALFSRLPEGAVLVMDNYQEVETSARFHDLVAMAIGEIPASGSLIAISRRDPPDCYARFIANDSVRFVEWEDLRLSLNEAEAVAGLHRQVSKRVLADLHQSTGGWAAGLVLALERSAAGMEPVDVSQATRDATFDYFASQIFLKLSDETQRFLMLTAYLPYVPVTLAQSLTGSPRAGAILEDLYRRHLFVHRRPAAEPTYWYHALFQEFLRIRSLVQFSSEELTGLRRRAARLLGQRGDVEFAVKLHCDLQDWDEVEFLVTTQAATLIAQGRWKIVLEWIRALPLANLEQGHWLLHWYGIAMMAMDPVQSRDYLERSFNRAVASGDHLCRVLAVSGVIQTYLLQYNNFRPLDRWIDELSQAIPMARFPSADAEVRTQSALLTALSFRKPDHPAIEFCALRVFELLPSVQEPNLRLSAAVYVLAWGCLSGPVEMAERALPIVNSLWVLPEITPLNAVIAGYIVSWHNCMMGNREQCLKAIARLQTIADSDGLPVARSYAATIGAWLELYACNLAEAEKWSGVLEKSIDASRAFDRASSDGVKAWLSVLKNEPLAAIEHARRAVQGFDDVGSVFHQVIFRFHLIWGHILTGELDTARLLIRERREMSLPLKSVWPEITLCATEAFIALTTDDRAVAEERIRTAFRASRERNHDHALGQNMRPWMGRLCAVALNSGIEVEYVKKLIKHHNWLPPTERPEAWPWLVRVYALGGFRVVVGGSVLAFPHKIPRKPMALLKALVAFGSRAVPQWKLMDAIWPEQDGDAAYHSLGTNLHRLRKLLGSPDSVLLTDGRVSLNEQLVWTDVEFFDQSAGHSGQDKSVVEAALSLYGGSFLAEAEDAPWAMTRRERMRAMFVRQLMRVGSELEQAGSPEQAAVWYLRGLDADDLVEEFYQGLIRCHLAQGQRVQAQGVFRQLSATFHASLGARPSQATEALFRSTAL